MRPSARVLLDQAQSPAMLISDLTNIRYLTGLSVSSGLLLALPRGYLLFVDARYGEAASRLARSGVVVRPIDFIERYLLSVRVCAIEERQVTVARMRLWKRKFKSTKFVRSDGIVEGFRRTKDTQELTYIRRAQRITQELLRRVPAALRKGISERSLAWSLGAWGHELGADSLSFPPIVAFGTHTSRPHHEPTARTLRKGHIVQIDVGAVYKGYCADMSRVFFTSALTPIQEKAFRAVSEAKDAALAKAKNGASTQELDRLARSVLRTYGVEKAFTHSLGHGVGLAVHEGVTLSERAADAVLLPGEVITVEPGVYFPGQFGMRVEDMVIVR